LEIIAEKFFNKLFIIYAIVNKKIYNKKAQQNFGAFISGNLRTI